MTQKTTKKIVESFEVILETEEGTKLSFEDVLLSSFLKDAAYPLFGKDVSMTILETGNTIIGIMETTRAENVPPKKHRKKKKTTRLDLGDGEGLAYGNIFLYEKKRKILMYEVNKFGCYVDHFVQFLQRCCTEDEKCDWSFAIKLNPILRPNEYERMKKMDFYKSLELEFANPEAIIKSFKHNNSPLKKAAEAAKELHTETFMCKFNVKSKRQGGNGLASMTLRTLVDDVKRMLGTKEAANIKKVTIAGYATDDEGDEKLEPIDLLADRYLQHISLAEPRLNDDLLQAQRSNKILALYKECKPDFAAIFGSN